MTSSNPPPGDPAFTSEPQMMSPVSPKPLHYPVPQNIPILEKQMDQAFNQTTAHMASQQPPVSAPHDSSANNTTNDTTYPPSATATAENNASFQAASSQQSHAVESGMHLQAQTEAQAQGSRMNNAPPGHAPAEFNATAAAPAASAPSEQLPVQASNEPIPIQPEPHAVDPNPPHANVTAQSLESSHTIPPSTQPRGVTIDASSSAPDVDNNSRHLQFQASLQDFLASYSQANPQAQPQPQANSSVAEVPQAEGNTPDVMAAATTVGLPPKPPAQEQPSIHPSYNTSTDIRAYHPHSSHPQPPANTQQNPSYNSSAQLPAFPPAPGQNAAAAPVANGLPPPPLASFQQQQQQPNSDHLESPTSKANRQRELESQREKKQAAGEVLDDADVPWTPETQRKYDVFLNEERKYVTEGNWEQFPHGSRLFVGNLSSERVTKRDIFHVFHRYGHLAQISIKQAYGFVQYLEPDACARAMQVEQGKIIRGKKTHLEVSKPQKNRNSDTKGGRRSRSPEHARGGSSVDRYQPGAQDRRGDNRNRRGGRADYRRSPTPPTQGRYRSSRDRSRDRYDGRYRSRSRSPYSRSRYRSPSPRRTEDDDLPLPSRRPEEVPDVQFIVLDALDRDFINYIERSFTSRGIRVDVLFLSPRLSLDAVVKRQVLEGVHAVSKLTRLSQQTVKISLQLYDRRNPSNVRFDEYQDLDLNIAAELVLRAKAQAVPTYQRAPMPVLPVQFGYGGGIGLPSPQLQTLPQMPPAVSLPAQPDMANLISSLDPTGLQKLLGAMQNPAAQHAAMTGVTPDLAKLLVNTGAALAPPPPLPPPPPPPHPNQQNHMTFAQNGSAYSPMPPPSLGGAGMVADPLAALRANPVLAGLLAQASNQQTAAAVATSPTPMMVSQQQQQQQSPQQQRRQPQPQQQQQPSQHDMAEILARLGSYGQQR